MKHGAHHFYNKKLNMQIWLPFKNTNVASASEEISKLYLTARKCIIHKKKKYLRMPKFEIETS